MSGAKSIDPAIERSEEDEEPKPVSRTNSGRVIVFDPVKQTLTTEKAKNLDSEYSAICAKIIITVVQSKKPPPRKRHPNGAAVSAYMKSQAQNA